jgi:hypothetical protein
MLDQDYTKKVGDPDQFGRFREAREPHLSVMLVRDCIEDL